MPVQYAGDIGRGALPLRAAAPAADGGVRHDDAGVLAADAHAIHDGPLHNGLLKLPPPVERRNVRCNELLQAVAIHRHSVARSDKISQRRADGCFVGARLVDLVCHSVIVPTFSGECDALTNQSGKDGVLRRNFGRKFGRDDVFEEGNDSDLEFNLLAPFFLAAIANDKLLQNRALALDRVTSRCCSRAYLCDFDEQ